MTVYQFMSGSPFLGFLVICSAYYLAKGLLRTVRIVVRGWPPAHCDADGDARENTP